MFRFADSIAIAIARANGPAVIAGSVDHAPHLLATTAKTTTKTV